ncbi:hypothetical protein JVT61DRAFT_9508 [Boletus reticuloceps]|uniref:Uncharacterized protein n=1 Tax=Boletus reticuloceps TaxID=495285 RepID=A0A8I3A561_9AGAM|nr:hypothetical protein JVT61DRAFT_9508 [Boletus reticuloceps]
MCPVVAYAGPSLFPLALPVDHVPALPVVVRSTQVASDLDTNIDPVLLADDEDLYAGGASEVPPAIESCLPVTQIIPPTPFGHKSGVLHEDNTSLPQDESEPSTPISGRRSARVNKILNEGYEQLEKTLTNLVAQTSLMAQQVLDGWCKSHGHIINGTNHWNSYARYLTKNEEQECRRLGLPAETPITPTICRQLYTKFKEDNGENWQEILEIHNMLELSDSSPQTIVQCAQMFNKTCKRVMSLLDAAAAKHGLEAALVMCGKTINEDASLGFVHMMAGAKQFFDTRCHADEDTIIGHHTYSNHHVSLEIVSDAFDGQENQLIPSRDKVLNAPLLAPQHKPPPCSSGDSLVQQPPPAHTSDKAEHAQIERPGSNDDTLSYIKTSITSVIKEAGGDTSKFKPGSFPWTSLATILAEQGLVMRGWPTLVRMPGEQRGQTARTKGITVLKKAEQRALYDALENTDISVTRVEGRDEQSESSNV